MDTTIHITPNKDLKAHIESVDCPCHPRVEMVYNAVIEEWSSVVIHNSYDGREVIEKLQVLSVEQLS